MFEANFHLIFIAGYNEHEFTGTMNRGFSSNSRIQFIFTLKCNVPVTLKPKATSIELQFAFETVNFLLRFFTECQTQILYLISFLLELKHPAINL